MWNNTSVVLLIKSEIAMCLKAKAGSFVTMCTLQPSLVRRPVASSLMPVITCVTSIRKPEDMHCEGGAIRALNHARLELSCL